eukprot:1654783-Prymnesium_polylepis.1
MAAHGGEEASLLVVKVNLLDLRGLARAVGEDDTTVLRSTLVAVGRWNETRTDRTEHLVLDRVDRALAEPVRFRLELALSLSVWSESVAVAPQLLGDGGCERRERDASLARVATPVERGLVETAFCESLFRCKLMPELRFRPALEHPVKRRRGQVVHVEVFGN